MSLLSRHSGDSFCVRSAAAAAAAAVAAAAAAADTAATPADVRVSSAPPHSEEEEAWVSVKGKRAFKPKGRMFSVVLYCVGMKGIRGVTTP